MSYRAGAPLRGDASKANAARPRFAAIVKLKHRVIARAK